MEAPNVLNYKCNLTERVKKRYNIKNLLDSDEIYRDCDILIWSGNDNFSIDDFARFPNVKVFLNWGSATSNIPEIDEFARRGIKFENLKNVCTQAVSEFAVFLLIKLFNRAKPVRKELFQKKVGIIGLGSIGTNVANILSNGFSCDISYFSRTKKDTQYVYTPLEEIIKKVDALVVSVDSKEFSITVEMLKKATKKLVIVNISRDFSIPSLPIIKAIEEGTLPNIDIISDVAVSEELFDRYKDYYTPHIAYKSEESILLKENIIVKLIKKYEEGL